MATLESKDFIVRKSLGNVPATFWFPINEPRSFKESGEHFVIHIASRNGLFYQELVLYPKGRYWTSSMRLSKYNESKQKFEEIKERYNYPKDFPIAEDEIEWELDY